MNKHPGMGVMIGMIGGNEDTARAVRASLGKAIEHVTLVDDAATFQFTDGSRLTLHDDGQSCCESRYMRTDDTLTDFSGATLTNLEIREAPDAPDEYGEHEVQFLVAVTDKGNLTFSSHNEHNGYYGGFWITATLTEAAR